MSAFMSVVARRTAAAALAAGALVGTFAASASADAAVRPGRDRVEISGAQYDSPGWDNGTNRSLNKEWVDVTNTSRHAVNLDGWTLSARDGRTYTFHHYRLAARSTVRVHTGVGRDSGRDVYQDRRRYAWDNRSDTATLRDDRNRRVDTLSWGGHRDDRGHGHGHGHGGHR
ncbi:lamin tail domain-containing protein [Streptomyces sp. NBC_00063]|uniref:lamin tail domain-containing protein n=1 Tax=Streptomyces sp. NBC_00063 TaxID=2975638 RepID=UPI00224F1F9C|nr:lamin tail domain-containing protein [Streptomyces sp. NBC_00063]MCX5442397.1 lamin tail domain-containing protein [Streptomyces sp. NBC_00063]